MYPIDRLRVWHRAQALSRRVLHALRPGPDPRTLVIAQQAWRAVTSIGANIAEGAGSGSHALFARYLGVAIASAHELDSHLALAPDTGVLTVEEAAALRRELDELNAMLWVLRERVRGEPARRHPRPPPAA